MLVVHEKVETSAGQVQRHWRSHGPNTNESNCHERRVQSRVGGVRNNLDYKLCVFRAVVTLSLCVWTQASLQASFFHALGPLLQFLLQPDGCRDGCCSIDIVLDKQVACGGDEQGSLGAVG